MVGQHAKQAGVVSRRRKGMALPASLAAITAVSVLISGIWVIVDLNAKTSSNRRSALNALLVAESGLSHSLALLRGDLKPISLTRLLRGNDSVANNSDDGLLIGYSALSTDETIPAAGKSFGGGTYFVTIEDDPAETDGNTKLDANQKVLLRCRGTMPDGASAEIQAIVGMIPLPAIATEGILRIGGNPKVTGACGALHANEIIEVSGNPIVSGAVTASDTVKATSCKIKKPDGTCNVPLHNQPPIDIPPLTMSQVCVNPTLTLKASGVMIDHASGTTYSGSTTRFGWKWSGDKWESDDETPYSTSNTKGVRAGTICAEHDVVVGKNWGSSGTPLQMSIYSSRSVIISGNPTFTAHDPEGGLIIAEGDVEISGNPSTGTHNNYAGMVYAGAQCKINGNPRLKGQILCKDKNQPGGHKNWVAISDLNADVSGNPEIIFDCTGSMLSKRKILSWVQKLGS